MDSHSDTGLDYGRHLANGNALATKRYHRTGRTAQLLAGFIRIFSGIYLHKIDPAIRLLDELWKHSDDILQEMSCTCIQWIT
jgi:hypothetical protein